VFLSFPSLAVINYLLLKPTMGISFAPVPSGSGFGWGIGIGILIPIFSSIVPLKVVLGKNLNDALDYSHSKTKAVFVKILRANQLQKDHILYLGL